jgi:hypothetical protein
MKTRTGIVLIVSLSVAMSGVRIAEAQADASIMVGGTTEPDSAPCGCPTSSSRQSPPATKTASV